MPRWLGLTSRAMSSTASGTTPFHRDRQIKLLFPDRPLVDPSAVHRRHTAVRLARAEADLPRSNHLTRAQSNLARANRGTSAEAYTAVGRGPAIGDPSDRPPRSPIGYARRGLRECHRGQGLAVAH